MSDILVPKSLSGISWIQARSAFSPAETQRRAARIESIHALAPALCWYLASQGLESEMLDSFFEPRLRESLPNPSIMQDADRAITIICDALQKKQPIGLFGDYDVDGACSAALFKLVLAAYGVPVFCHIPDRFTEGYGPNLAALQRLKQQGAGIILTVDCGISAFEPLARAAETGIPIIVIDHHKAGTILPQAVAVVNPNRLDDNSGLGDLCATGVCFLILVGLMREIRKRGISVTSGKEPDLKAVLDLVALATVCDVVPLTGLNRVFVKQGLKVLAKRKNLGLRVLMDVAGLKTPPTAHTLGFVLGPRINAGGRLGQSDLGLQLLVSNDADIAGSLAVQLNQLNLERKTAEQIVLAQAEEFAIKRLDAEPDLPILVLASKGWHEGVIGIVAGRLKDKYHRPTIIIAIDGEGLGRGSARSISGFSVGNHITAAFQLGLLRSGGGHDMAAGLSVSFDNLPAFEKFMNERAAQCFAGTPKKLFIATHLVSVAGLTLDFAQQLDDTGPFGSHFAEPRLVIPHCRLRSVRWIGSEQQHLTLRIEDDSPRTIRAIAFNLAGSDLGRALKDQPDPGPVKILGKLRRNDYQGAKTIQFEIEDIALEV